MEYRKIFDPEELRDITLLVMEDKEMEVGTNGICSDYDPEKVKINKKVIIRKGEVIAVRRKENNRYVLSRSCERTFIPVEEFPKIKTIQSGDLVQFGKGQIGTVARIYDAGHITIKIREGKLEDPGEENGKTIIGINDISTVASLKITC